MKLRIAIIVILCIGLCCSCAGIQRPVDVQAVKVEDPVLTVLNPLGTPPSIKLKSMAPRLDTLEGKTVYVVDNIYPGSDLLLTEMAAWFEREMPKTKAIYKRKNAMGFEGEDPALWAEIKEKADAVIIGLGH